MKFYQLNKHPSYEISKSGIVRKISTKKVLNQRISSYGYYVTTLVSYGVRRVISTHRLLAEQFIPNPKNLRYVVTKNGNKLNISLSNLKFTTYPCDNSIYQSKRINGTKYRLTKTQVVEIKKMLGLNTKQTEIARKFNISNQTVFSIKHSKTWKNV
jgi:hypothetical protein